MATISSLRDDELDKLLAGRTPNGRGELAPLADVATAIRRRVAEEPAPVMSYQLRNAVAEGAAPSVVRPRRLLPAAVAAFALAGVGLAGAANALPAQVQDVVSDAGDLVGIDIPPASDDNLVDTRDAGDTGDGTTTPSGEDEGSDAKDSSAKGDGPPDSTPGGATPADPGTPGDKEPATPAVPPEHSNGGNDNGTGPGSGNGQGDGNGNANGKAKEHDTGNADG